jgi:hypothetical protein
VKVYGIYDNRRPDAEVETFRAELARQGIEAELNFSLNFFSTVEMNINFAHKLLVKLALEHGEPEVCILEADVWFPAADGWQYFLQHKPDDFDLYLGGVYGLSALAKARLTPGVVPVHTFAGMHCYIIAAKYYDKFLSVPDDQHIDLAQAGLGKFMVCYPFAALQREGWSANSRKKEDKNVGLKMEDVYGWERAGSATGP